MRGGASTRNRDRNGPHRKEPTGGWRERSGGRPREPTWLPPASGLSGVQSQGERGLRRGVRESVLLGQPSDRGAGGEELGCVLAPDVIEDADAHSDDAR